MAVPKKRHSKSRRDKRRSHLSLKAPQLVKCPKCNKPRLPHRVCPNCGYYRKEQMVDVFKKLEKKEKKKKEKEIEAEEKQKKKKLSWEKLSRK